MRTGYRLYIAAPWQDRGLAMEAAAKLEAAGHTITHRWWEKDGEYDDAPLMRECAEADRQGVRAAHILVLLNTAKSEGKAVEQGLALAWDIPIIGIGFAVGSKNIFHHLADYEWVDSIEEVIDALSEQ